MALLFIGLEALNIKAMQRLWGRKIGDYGFSDFVSILQYAASKVGTQIVHVDKWYPSSQLCSACGYRFNGTKDLRVRRWICPHCGAEHDRDVNAACNILTEALCIADKQQRCQASFKLTPGGTLRVRPTPLNCSWVEIVRFSATDT